MYCINIFDRWTQKLVKSRGNADRLLTMNPNRAVKTERFSRTEGKTLALVEGGILAIDDQKERK
jgi:hypothetical protein